LPEITEKNYEKHQSG